MGIIEVMALMLRRTTEVLQTTQKEIIGLKEAT